jgi:hypothetical protein
VNLNLPSRSKRPLSSYFTLRKSFERGLRNQQVRTKT